MPLLSRHNTFLLLLFKVITILGIPTRDGLLYSFKQSIPRSNNLQDTKLFLKEYDFIVVGAGPPGSAVTNRLTEVPGWNVLLLEAGTDAPFFTDIPLVTSFGQLTNINWGYKTEPSDSACQSMVEKRCSWPRGKVIGGTSVLNNMINHRGQMHDYNTWAALGNKGWGFNDLLPYFRKLEDMTMPALMNSPYHSTGGYVTVEKVSYHTPLLTAFLGAAQERGYDIGDYNGESPSKFSYIQATTRKGKRMNAAKAYLIPIRDRPNFHLAKKAHVTKILIDPKTKRAYGVEFVKLGRTQTVNATREVILSAGAINTPQLLMLSGIGPRKHLEDLGIPVLADLRVGYNLQDHVSSISTVFLLNNSVGIRDTQMLNPKILLDYLIFHTGPLTIPGGAEGLGFVHTKYADPSKDRPDAEILLASACAGSEQLFSIFKFQLGLTDEAYQKYVGGVGTNWTWCGVPMTMRPQSKGRIKLQSTNPFDPPLMYHNYFHDHHDLEIMIDGIKKIIELSETDSFQKFGSSLYRTPAPGCENLEFGTDEYWECSIRSMTVPANHQCSTCKMGPPSDSEAVVSPELKVYGIEGLRVIDASIMPTLPSAHLTTPCYMIGEKGADLIKERWGKV